MFIYYKYVKKLNLPNSGNKSLAHFVVTINSVSIYLFICKIYKQNKNKSGSSE